MKGRCLEEGLFCGDDLTARERGVLERYARSHPADTDPRGLPERDLVSNPDLQLLSAAEFRALLYKVVYKGRGLLVAFNFPFDVSRLALGYSPSRGRFLGGFSFQFFQYQNAAGATLTDQPHDRPWGIYSGYFRDPDGHLWEIIWNPRGENP